MAVGDCGCFYSLIKPPHTHPSKRFEFSPHPQKQMHFHNWLTPVKNDPLCACSQTIVSIVSGGPSAPEWLNEEERLTISGMESLGV